MHLFAPRNRYMNTTASKGRMLFMKVTMYVRRGVQIMGWSVRMAFNGLLHTVIRLLRRQKRLDFFPDSAASEHASVYKVRANQLF